MLKDRVDERRVVGVILEGQAVNVRGVELEVANILFKGQGQPSFDLKLRNIDTGH